MGEKMAQHFEKQMQQQMQKCKENKSRSSENDCKNAENSRNTETSTSKNTESSTSKTNNGSTTRMNCPLMFGSQMFTPNMFETRNGQKNCQKTQNNCQKTCTKPKQPTSVSIPLKRFNPEQVAINMNKNGLVTVTASRENTEESNRNGQRKTTIMIEETCQLPGYLVDNDLLKTVESKFHDGFLVLSFAEDPKVVEEREAEERKNAPIEIPIMMED